MCVFAEKSLKEILPFYLHWSLAKHISVSVFCGTAPPLCCWAVDCFKRALRQLSFLYPKTPTLTADRGLRQSAKVAHLKKKREKTASSYLLCIIVDFPECFFIAFGPVTVLFNCFTRHLPLRSLHFPSQGWKQYLTFTGNSAQQTEKIQGKDSTTAY